MEVFLSHLGVFIGYTLMCAGSVWLATEIVWMIMQRCVKIWGWQEAIIKWYIKERKKKWARKDI